MKNVIDMSDPNVMFKGPGPIVEKQDRKHIPILLNWLSSFLSMCVPKHPSQKSFFKILQKLIHSCMYRK